MRSRHHISASRRRELRASTVFLRRLEERFSKSKSPVDLQKGRLLHDLGEVHEICTTVSDRISRLVSPLAKDRRRLSELLEDVQVELFIHLPYHITRLRTPLDRAIGRLQSPEEGAKTSVRGQSLASRTNRHSKH
jgi:hypothetical protein